MLPTLAFMGALAFPSTTILCASAGDSMQGKGMALVLATKEEFGPAWFLFYCSI